MGFAEFIIGLGIVLVAAGVLVILVEIGKRFPVLGDVLIVIVAILILVGFLLALQAGLEFLGERFLEIFPF